MKEGFSVLERTGRVLRAKMNFGVPLETREFFGRRLTLRVGTFRKEPDYDDAWHLLCLVHAKTVFDVGANIGQNAVVACLLDNIIEVVLFEANPNALSVASENLIRNHLIQKARLVCGFVGSLDGTSIRLWTVGSGAAGSAFASHAKTAAGLGSSIEAPVVTLDCMSQRLGTFPDFVKVDVEGAEHQVLLGSCGIARQMQTRFLVEMHSNAELPMSENGKDILKWVEENNYKAWYLSAGVELTSAAQLAHRGRCHLLLQPCHWPYPDWLKNVSQSADPGPFLEAFLPKSERESP